MKRRFLFLLLFLLPLTFSTVQAQQTPPERTNDLPLLDTSNQIDMWSYGNPADLAWSQDSEMLALATSAAILLYDVNDLEREPAFLPAQSGAHSAVAFHDNRLMAADNAGGLWSWDVSSGEATLFAAVAGGFRDMVVSEDTIIAWTGDWLYVFDAESGERIHALFIDYDSESQRNAFIAVSSDGTKVAVSEYLNPVQVWDISGAEAVLTELAQPNEGEWFEPLAFSADNTVLFGVDNLGLYAWDWENDEKITHDWGDMLPIVNHAVVLDDGHLLTFDSAPWTGANITRWSPDDLTEPVQTTPMIDTLGWGAITLSPDHTFIAALEVEPDGAHMRLTMKYTESLEVFYVSGTFLQINELIASDVSIAYNPLPGTLTLRDIYSGEETNTLSYNGGFAITMTMSEDGQRLALCTVAPGNVLSFDPIIFAFYLDESTEPRLIYDVFDNDTGIYAGCRWMLYNGDFLTDAASPTGVYAALEEKLLVQFPEGAFFNLDDMALAGDTAWLTGQDLGLYKANLSTGELVQMLENDLVKEEGFIGYIASISALYDTTLVFVSGEQGRSVVVYDTETEETLYSLDLDTTVTALTFSPDGSMIITGDDAGTIRTWDAETGESPGQFGRVSGAIRSLVVSPDGTRLYSAGSDGVGRVWRME